MRLAALTLGGLAALAFSAASAEAGDGPAHRAQVTLAAHYGPGASVAIQEVRHGDRYRHHGPPRHHRHHGPPHHSYRYYQPYPWHPPVIAAPPRVHAPRPYEYRSPYRSYDFYYRSPGLSFGIGF